MGDREKFGISPQFRVMLVENDFWSYEISTYKCRREQRAFRLQTMLTSCMVPRPAEVSLEAEPPKTLRPLHQNSVVKRDIDEAVRGKSLLLRYFE